MFDHIIDFAGEFFGDFLQLIIATVLYLIVAFVFRLIFREGIYKAISNPVRPIVVRVVSFAVATIMVACLLWGAIHLGIKCFNVLDYLTAFVLWIVAAVLFAFWLYTLIKALCLKTLQFKFHLRLSKVITFISIPIKSGS